MKKRLLMVCMILGCSQGSQGPVGTSCSVTTIQPEVAAPNGGTMLSCTDGTQSLILNGTLVTSVQFCPGMTTYPNQFNEIGFCINDNIYGVYSFNDGFLTLVPPGTYSSDGINSSCTFTVGTNCSINH